MPLGRQKESAIYQYFDYERVRDISKCSVGDCVTELKGRIVTNMKAHLKKKHPEKFKEFEKIEEKRSQVGTKKPQQIQAKLDFETTKKRITIDLDKKEVEAACVEMVTFNGRSYSAVEDSGFRRILSPILTALNMSMNRQKVSDLVREHAAALRTKIRSDLASTFVCVKLYIASRHTRKFLGLNIQYAVEGKLQLMALTVQELHENPTGQSVNLLLKDVLARYGIEKEQVHSVTIDNGSNLIRAFRLAMEEQDPETLDDEEEKDVEDEIENIVSGLSGMSWPIVMRCASHTLQLSVEDFLKSRQNIITHANELARKMRVPTMRHLLREAKLPVPTLECPTHWSSTYDMLESLLKIETTIKIYIKKDVLEHKQKINFWKEAKQLAEVLQPAKTACVFFQTSKLTAGQFHEHWVRIKIAIERAQSPKKKDFLEAINKRESVLLQNKGLLAAIYMDPVYKSALNRDQIVIAREVVKEVCSRLSIFTSQSVDVEIDAAQPQSSLTVGEPSEEDIYESLILGDAGSPNCGPDATHDIEKELMEFEKSPRVVDRSSDVMMWWHSSSYSALLKKAAGTVLSMPVTQVSVERMFSGLKFVLSDQRTALSKDSVDDIMLLRTNHKFDYCDHVAYL